MALNNWEKIFETSFPHRAEIVQDYLEQQGISVVVVNKQDSSYHFGKCELYVSIQDAIIAKTIVANEISFE
ncbi:MAG: putative signal transducing protein [Runella sp.]